MKDALILEQKLRPLKGPWGGIYKGEDDEECGDSGCNFVIVEMLGNVTRTTGRVLAT